MLFNSYEFIFLFLPITLGGYYFLGNQKNSKWANGWLVCLSLFFYSYWNIKYLPLLMGSILVNYFFSGGIIKYRESSKRFLGRLFFVFGIFFNISLLCFYKYMDFFIENINVISGMNIPLMHIILPLGISFFTITQMVYLVDCYNGVANDHDFINYSLFVSFFPHLLAGPILYHKPMMKQFSDKINQRVNWSNLRFGLVVFSIGLGKKVLIADSFGFYAQIGFLHVAHLTLLDGWLTALCYTLQLYFDFSGYSDMALGLAKMLNINIPVNFNSPYKARSIIDFWRRWHISLSMTVKDYIYIPLGGNRSGEKAKLRNILVTMFIVGLWHGASWSFVVWGGLHGIFLIINHLWRRYGWPLPGVLNWSMTFLAVVVAWVIFRGNTLSDAWNILESMMGLHGVVVSSKMMKVLTGLPVSAGDFVFPIAPAFLWVVGGILITTQLPNALQVSFKIKNDWYWACALGLLLVASILSMGKVSEFLYFQF